MSSEIQNTNQRLANLVASAEDAIIGQSLTGFITSWNRAAERLFGFTAAEAIGQSISLITPPALYAQEESVLQEVRKGLVVEHYETLRRTKDGTQLLVSLTISPIKNADGIITGASKIARPITEHRLLQRHAQHLAAIVDSSDDAIVSKDLNGVVLSWNPAAERLFGYSAGEMIGHSIRVLIPADRQSEEDRVLESVRVGDVVDHFATVRRCKDGSLVPISLTVSPIRDDTGRIIGASKIARDMSREERTHRDAMRLASIVDSSDDAIVSKDLSSVITSWNSAAERLFGFSVDEAIGQSVRILIPHDRQHEEDHVLGRIKAGQRVEHYETVRQRKDGSLIPVSLTVSPIRDASGSVVGASKIARDISDRERTEQERQRLLEIARSASRLKDEFLATLSHELRTPLNGIVGYVRLMQMGLLTGEKLDHALDAVGRSVTSLVQIVEDVLDVSRIVSGKLRLQMQVLDLHGVIRRSVDVVRPSLEAKQISLDLELDPDTTTIFGDPERLQQVLWNILSNAAKFTPRGGDVRIRLEQRLSHVAISVADTGAGISAEFLPFVFDRFSQAEGGMTRSTGGLGLGLAISKHLVELQGGRISASSEGAGTGATFRVELPVHGQASVSSSGSATVAPPAPSNRVLELPRLSGCHILAVDDDNNALLLVREILEMAGATVITADSVEKALGILERTTPDALLADLGMPHLSGFDLIASVRQSDRPEIRDLPAAALTAYARSEDRALSLQRGFNLHLPKPIDPGQLLDSVATLVKSRKP